MTPRRGRYRPASDQMDGPGRMSENEINEIETAWDETHDPSEVAAWADAYADWMIGELRWLRKEIAQLRAYRGVR